MTEQKHKSAGYFDSVRNCPVYEGDVYYDATLIEPYFRIVHSEEKSESIEEVAETEKSAVEEQANNELKEVNEQLKENVETMFDAPSKEAEPANEEITEKAETEEKSTNKNVIVEVAKEAVPEIIANTKDEKNAVMRKRFLTNLISKNKDKIADLEVKVDYHTELSQTLDYKPFVKLKEVVTEALHTNVDDENLKGIKERTKDFESISNIQGLLKQHQQKAKEAEYEITDLEDEISKFQDELDELEAKIDTFARQNKLPLESVTE